MPRVNPQDRADYARNYYQQNKECIAVRQREYRTRNRDRLAVYGREWHQRNKQRVAAYEREHRRRLRQEMFDAYGGKCACCGERELAFLTLDHIDGGGSKHRREIGASNICRQLKGQGWPEGYQVLCANCNMAKDSFGGCPHLRWKAVTTDEAPA